MKNLLKLLLILISATALFVLGKGYYVSHVKVGELTSIREEAEIVSEKKLAEQVDFLEKHGVLASEIASSKIDLCGVEHLDAGWTVRTWQQECVLWYVKGFTTKLSKQSVLEILRANPQTEPAKYDEPLASTDLFGKLKSPYGMEIFPCGLAEGAADTGITGPPNEDALSKVNRKIVTSLRFRPGGSTPKGSDCGIPNQYDGTIVSFDQPSIKMFDTFDPDTIDTSQNQVWITQEHRYYYDDLGCGLGIMCPNPRKDPIQAP